MSDDTRNARERYNSLTDEPPMPPIKQPVSAIDDVLKRCASYPPQHWEYSTHSWMDKVAAARAEVEAKDQRIKELKEEVDRLRSTTINVGYIMETLSERQEGGDE